MNRYLKMKNATVEKCQNKCTKINSHKLIESIRMWTIKMLLSSIVLQLHIKFRIQLCFEWGCPWKFLAFDGENATLTILSRFLSLILLLLPHLLLHDNVSLGKWELVHLSTYNLYMFLSVNVNICVWRRNQTPTFFFLRAKKLELRIIEHKPSLLLLLKPQHSSSIIPFLFEHFACIWTWKQFETICTICRIDYFGLRMQWLQ